MLPDNKSFLVWLLENLGLCLDVIQWEIFYYLVDYGKILSSYEGNWVRRPRTIFSYCCRDGHFELVKWLWEIELSLRSNNHIKKYRNFGITKRSWELYRGINIHGFKEQAFKLCCESGNLHIAKWLWNLGLNGERKIDVNINGGYIFTGICKNGHLNILKWLWEEINISKRYWLDNNKLQRGLEDTIAERNINEDYKQILGNDLFKISCMNGHLNIAKWLLDILPSIEVYNLWIIYNWYSDELPFETACKNGHLNIVMWLWNRAIKDGNNTYNELRLKYIEVCCKNNHRDIVKWWLDIYHDDNHGILKRAFETACEYGYLDMAKWLWNISSGEMGLGKSIYSLRPLALCCENGHLDVAKWLIDCTYFENILAPNGKIITQDLMWWDLIFRRSCENGHIDVAKWLCNITSSEETGDRYRIYVYNHIIDCEIIKQ